MPRTLKPRSNERLSFANHTLIWVKSGQGQIEVDFRSYSDFENRLIFLSPGQHICFPLGDFELVIEEFPESFVKQSKDYRVLFKHLISLGYIEFSEPESVLAYLLHASPSSLLDISSGRWFWQNPFNAEREEYQLIFDLKDVIDSHFAENWSVGELVSGLDGKESSICRLVKDRLGVSVKYLAQRKLLIESQNYLAFTDQPVQEVAYDLGFRDPAYFNRFFKRETYLTPLEFRETFGSEASDSFVQSLNLLVQQYHISERSSAFYAKKMHVSLPTLSRRVQQRLGTTVGALIRAEVVASAKVLLQSLSIKETAFALDFEEANHFSTFFKKHTGITPSEYKFKKSNP
ncbi:MAG: helix-turn-helix domain-containing protein [Ignavibacteriae bacterium]|nr:helix-turn-helix domain-containing protein [Ignavibacteriota bacterium]MCB9216481.1 helix-turn-helix domain-containing protein [Ignavibacteria bacterium]